MRPRHDYAHAHAHAHAFAHREWADGRLPLDTHSSLDAHFSSYAPDHLPAIFPPCMCMLVPARRYISPLVGLHACLYPCPRMLMFILKCGPALQHPTRPSRPSFQTLLARLAAPAGKLYPTPASTLNLHSFRLDRTRSGNGSSISGS
jgi:hypothetical protein